MSSSWSWTTPTRHFPQRQDGLPTRPKQAARRAPNRIGHELVVTWVAWLSSSSDGWSSPQYARRIWRILESAIMISWTLERTPRWTGPSSQSNVETLYVPFLRNPQNPLPYFGGGHRDIVCRGRRQSRLRYYDNTSTRWIQCDARE